MRARVLAAGAFALGSLVVFAAPGSGAGAAGADPTAGISSDGSSAPIVEAGGTVSASYAGTGGPTSEMKVDLRGFAPMTANGRMESGTESIIGPDSRIRVNPTTTYPARAVVLITFNTPQGGSRCTGWFINANTVATAGHCVHQGVGMTNGFYSVSSYRIYPGYNGTVAPYGVCNARRLSTVTGWADNDVADDDQYDYAAIKLSTNCNTKGNVTGWFGYTTVTALNQGTVINGYPGDKPFTQWRSSDRVRVLQPRRVFYQNDTIGGMSGSAVVGANAACNPCAIAVHAYGTYGSAPFSTNNHGTRIVIDVFNNLTAWKNAP